MTGIYVLLIITIGWCAILTFWLLRINSFFSKLSRIKKDNLVEILRKIIKNQDASKKEFTEIYTELARIDKEKAYSIQRIGFVKYKPFGKDEVENSFIMAFLDKHGTGVVITSIQLQDRSRVYSKEVIRGKSLQKLSSEERLAISRAMKI